MTRRNRQSWVIAPFLWVASLSWAAGVCGQETLPTAPSFPSPQGTGSTIETNSTGITVAPEVTDTGPSPTDAPSLDGGIGSPLGAPPARSPQLNGGSGEAEDSIPDVLQTNPLAPDLASQNQELTGQEEVIRERYSDGTVKVERSVVQDDEQNYVNHGSWKMWDEGGQPLCQGQYRFGQRHGPWRRYYKAAETQLLNSAPYNQFTPPFRSEAEFVNGQLNGAWRIVDAEERKICEWEFLDGRRHGKSAWWYPNAQPMREINYEDGVIQGEILEWDPQGRIVTQDRFINGRRLVDRVEKYAGGQKESEGLMLYPKLTLKEPDDWWECRLAQYEQQGKAEKHGKWTVWYENGQKKVEGVYEHDRPVNKFTWWHPNGQKALEGDYVDSRKSGQWTWWHENGQKSIQGEYVEGTPLGPWTWWESTGKMAQRAEFTGGQPRVIADGQAPARPSPLPAPAHQGNNPSARYFRGARK